MTDSQMPGVFDGRNLFSRSKRKPTARELLTLLGDAFLVDVLRRCSRRGCWKRGVAPTLLSGRMCLDHWNGHYSEE